MHSMPHEIPDPDPALAGFDLARCGSKMALAVTRPSSGAHLQRPRARSAANLCQLMSARFVVVLGLLGVFGLSGCGPAIVGGAVMGAAVLHDRRGATTVIDDQRIALLALQEIYADPALRTGSRVTATSYNGIVLLTGEARDEAQRERIGKAVARISNVRRVVNELAIGPTGDLLSDGADTLLGSRVKLALSGVQLPDFDPTRVKVVTSSQVVYLMGLVTAAEAEAVVEKVRYVPGVRRVVKVFEIIDPPTPGSRPR